MKDILIPSSPQLVYGYRPHYEDAHGYTTQYTHESLFWLRQGFRKCSGKPLQPLMSPRILRWGYYL